MAGFRPADEGQFVLKSKAGETPLVFGEDYVPGRNPLAAETRLSAPLVFVGYGVVAGKRDDYAGLNVKGKIVVALSGAPKSFQTEERAYYSSARTKRLEAEKRGAIENGGQAAFTSFLRDNYHKPSDDLSLPIRYDAGAKFARLNYEIAREIADAEARPAWNRGDFFGTLFAMPAKPAGR